MSEFEHGQLTPWGYIIDCETLPDLITTTDFSNFTNGRFGTTDTRISSSIPSASAGIRNYCGWHISPSLDCGMIYNVRDLRDAFVGGDLLVQLPATFVTDVKKVVLNAKWNEDAGDWDGEIIEDSDRFDFGMGDGLLKIYDVGVPDRRAKIFIKYTAGFPNTAIPLVKEIAANSVARALTTSYGVTSETAGGVSVSYSSAWSGKGSGALMDDTRETLGLYKVKGVY